MSLSRQPTSYSSLLKIDNAPPITRGSPRPVCNEESSIQYIWWPKIFREIQFHGENCIECVKAGKNLKPLSNHNTSEKLPTVEKPNQEMDLDFAGPLPLVWGTKI